jgi:hypothetical protein
MKCLVVAMQLQSKLFLGNRHGAEAARGAHNSEDTRSKRVAGIFQFGSFKETARGTYVPLKPHIRNGA